MYMRQFAAGQLADIREGGTRRLWEKLTPLAASRGRHSDTYDLDLEPARAEARVVSSLLCGQEQSAFDVVYDNRCSSYAYGNFMDCVMTARYLAARGARVRFVIVDPVARRPDWITYATPEEQDHFVRNQVRMAGALLRDHVEVTLERETSTEPASAIRVSARDRHVLFGKFVGWRRIWQHFAPTLLNQLVAEQGLSSAPGFLLELGDFPESAAAVTLAQPYSAWAIRRDTLRGCSRDATPHQILCDFRSITRRFPSHKVMLFSTPPGRAFAREVLSQRPEYSDEIEPRLVDQPASDFVEAIPWVLGSAFYYQWSGGGMSGPAIYSTIPYHFVQANTGQYSSYRKGRLTVWAGADQRWSIRPLMVRYRRARLGSR
ncbi:MAG: hypothetical protein U0904_02015 [Candidatus Nanopelagicales bacterium]|nr:hypothetical protein [Candidatus Nanopelagicales bacterium]